MPLQDKLDKAVIMAPYGSERHWNALVTRAERHLDELRWREALRDLDLATEACGKVHPRRRTAARRCRQIDPEGKSWLNFSIQTGLLILKRD